MLDDAELLRRYVEEKSETAFAELVARHLDLVYTAALRQVGGDAHRAQDVAQVVFTTLARKADSLTRHPVLVGWLYTAAQHAAAKVIRSEMRRRAREQAAHAMHEPTATPDSSAIQWERVRPILDDAMGELSDRDREAVLLRFFAHRPFADIGAALQVSEDAARMRVDRALDKLHALLAKRGLTSTATALSAALSAETVGAAPAGLASTITGHALASAALGGMAAAGGIFMKMSTVITGAIAVVAIGTVSFQTHRLHQAKAGAAELIAERDGARAQLENLQRSIRFTASAVDTPNGFVSAESPRHPVVSPSAKAAQSATTTAATRAARLEAEAKAKAAAVALAVAEQEMRRTARTRSVMEASYRPVFAELGFSAPQIEQFMALVVQEEEARIRLLRELKDSGVAVDETTVQVVREQAQNEFHAAVQREFGAHAAATVSNFQALLPVRPLVDKIALRALHVDAPLNRRQAEQLTDILARNARNSVGNADLLALNAGAIDSQAAGVLSPAQLAACREVVAETIAQQTSETAVRWREATSTGMRPPRK